MNSVGGENFREKIRLLLQGDTIINVLRVGFRKLRRSFELQFARMSKKCYLRHICCSRRMSIGEITPARGGVTGTEITWENYNKEFLEKYFPTDVRSKKEIKFLELKQGNMYVADSATKFKELMRFFPQYNGVETEESKCVKFESGL